MSDKLDAGDTNTRKDYIRSIIDAVEVDDKAIRIIGSKDVLQAAIAGKHTQMARQPPPNLRFPACNHTRPRRQKFVVVGEVVFGGPRRSHQALPLGGQCVDPKSAPLAQSFVLCARGAVERGWKGQRHHSHLKDAWHGLSWPSAYPIPYPRIRDATPETSVVSRWLPDAPVWPAPTV